MGSCAQKNKINEIIRNLSDYELATKSQSFECTDRYVVDCVSTAKSEVKQSVHVPTRRL